VGVVLLMRECGMTDLLKGELRFGLEHVCMSNARVMSSALRNFVLCLSQRNCRGGSPSQDAL
jgi:hypothetical protein